MGAKKPAKIEEEIREHFENDPAITDISKVVLEVKSGGSVFKKKVKVELTGSVPTKTQKEKIERWIENKYGDMIDFESSLSVGG
ncbi:MAG: hypothetical protein ACOCVC_02860 [Spirochaeta sp.]